MVYKWFLREKRKSHGYVWQRSVTFSVFFSSCFRYHLPCSPLSHASSPRTPPNSPSRSRPPQVTATSAACTPRRTWRRTPRRRTWPRTPRRRTSPRRTSLRRTSRRRTPRLRTWPLRTTRTAPSRRTPPTHTWPRRSPRRTPTTRETTHHLARPTTAHDHLHVIVARRHRATAAGSLILYTHRTRNHARPLNTRVHTVITYVLNL